MLVIIAVISNNYFVIIIRVLVGVAFVTLLECKIPGYIKILKGLNKVGYKEILQPFSDGVKLKNRLCPLYLISLYTIRSQLLWKACVGDETDITTDRP